MGKRGEEISKSCGQKGMASRSAIRKLLGGVKMNKIEAQDAIEHVEKCGFCQTRIKNTIYAARKGKEKSPYLYSLKETLQKAKEFLELIN